MTDTHRSTPAFAAQRQHRMTGNGPTAPVTRTTTTDSTREASASTLWGMIEALTVSGQGRDWSAGYADAISDVLGVLQARGFTPTADGRPMPTAERTAPDLSSDERYLIRMGGFYFRQLGEGFTQDRAEAGRYSLGDAHRITHPNGPNGPRNGMTYEPENPASVHAGALGELDAMLDGAPGLDPSPAEQRERFAAIAATPKPSAADIRAMLERLTAWRFIDPDGVPGVADAAATMLDRLGVEVVTLELERDDLRRQLNTIAAQAKPVDGTTVALRVQEARRMEDRLRDPRSNIPPRAIANMMGELIGAVNDQARRLADAEKPSEGSTNAADIALAARIVAGHFTRRVPANEDELVGLISRLRWALLREESAAEELRAQLATATALIADAYPAVRLVNHWATWSDDSLWAYASSILRKFDGDSRRAQIFEAIAEIRRVARDRLGDDGYTIPPTYGDAARDRAAEVVRQRAAAGEIKSPHLDARLGYTTGEAYGDTVDALAKALGLERAA